MNAEFLRTGGNSTDCMWNIDENETWPCLALDLTLQDEIGHCFDRGENELPFDQPLLTTSEGAVSTDLNNGQEQRCWVCHAA